MSIDYSKHIRMSFLKFIGILFFTLLLTSCGYTWQNKRNPNANYAYDRQQCENEATIRIAPVIPQRSDPSYTSNCNRNGDNVSCTTTSNSDNRLNETRAQMETSNERRYYANNCMVTKGWVAAREN